MPDWMVLVKPHQQERQNVITLRRETHVVLDISLDRIPRQLPVDCSGIKIPATNSVKKYGYATGKTLLEFRIHLYGATTKRRYETICANCEKREGKKKGTPSLIDFHAECDIIDPEDGRIRVDFNFCCYPKCHKLGATEYL
jgi:hypothetical protein